MTHTFRHPKFFNELRKRNKGSRAISEHAATAADKRSPGPGQAISDHKRASRGDNKTVKHWNTGASSVRYRDQAGKRTSKENNIYDKKYTITLTGHNLDRIIYVFECEEQAYEDNLKGPDLRDEGYEALLQQTRDVLKKVKKVFHIFSIHIQPYYLNLYFGTCGDQARYP